MTHVVEAQTRLKSIFTPTTAVARVAIYNRGVTYISNSCTGKFPIDPGAGGDIDLSRSYYNPSVASSSASDPTSSGTNYVRRSFQQKSAASMGTSWRFLQTGEITATAYVNDWIALIESNLKQSNGALVPLRVDQFGLRVTEQ